MRGLQTQTRTMRQPEVINNGKLVSGAEDAKENREGGTGLVSAVPGAASSVPPNAAKGLTPSEMLLLREPVGKGSMAPSPSCLQISC